MGSFLFFAFSWWAILLRVVAIVHFIRRRPNFFWLWIILIHWVGALLYIIMEMAPDAGLMRDSFKVFPRRRRIHELEAIVMDNPAAGNFEELADLYLEEGKYERARECYNKAISSRTDSPDPFYRRSLAELHLRDYSAALSDLELVVARDPQYDFHRASGLLAHAYAKTDQPEKANLLFQKTVQISTLSETYFNYADFLASQGRAAEARVWARRILDKKPTLPSYLRRRERPWFRRAGELLRQLPAS